MAYYIKSKPTTSSVQQSLDSWTTTVVLIQTSTPCQALEILETFKDYNSFEIESEAWLSNTTPLATTCSSTKNEDPPTTLLHGWPDALLRIRHHKWETKQVDVVGLPYKFYTMFYNITTTTLSHWIKSLRLDGSLVNYFHYFSGRSNVNC